MSLLESRSQCVLAGSLEQLAILRDFINTVAPQYGCSDEDTFAFELSCDEAVANIFKHTFNDQKGQVWVEMWRDADDVTVQIKYYGRAFDPDSIPEPDLNAPLESRPTGGLGLYFMRQMMTRITYEFDAVNGNTLTMCRRAERKMENQ